MARNSGGTMTRVANSFSNPVVGTTIDPTNADALFDDIDTEITDSLSRSNKGAMLADLDHGAFSALFAERSSPSNPSANVAALFAKDVSTVTRLHWRDSAGTEDVIVGRASTDTLTNKTLTSPDINGGTADSLTSLSVRSTGAAFDLTFRSIEVLTAGRTITFDVGDAARAITLGGNITTAANLTTSGANALTLTTTGATNVTLPTTGTLATLAGSETLTNKSMSGGSNTFTNISGTSIRMGSDARGDLLYFNGTDYARLPKGSDGQFLKIGANDPVWEALPSGGDMLAANNLSDVADEDTSRTNLGIQYTLIDVQIFTSSGTWTRPAGTDAAEVWVVGPGGSGGSALGDSSQIGLGGGGGSGGVAYKWIDSGLASSETVTVGTGGAQPAAGANAGNNGSGASSFGAHCSASEGAGGANLTTGTSLSWINGGAAGIGSGGDLNIAGGPGGRSFRFSGTATGGSGEGGSNAFGGGGVSAATGSSDGVAGRGYGAGGSGALSNSTTGRQGGAGADGVVIVKSYKL